MGVRFPSVQSNTVVNAALVTTAETVVVATPPFSPSLDFSVVLILAYVLVSAGTGTTGIVARIRRGTTVSGAPVQTVASNITMTAAQLNGWTFFYFDSPGAVSGQQYCLTLAQSNASANGAITDAAMLAFAL